MLALQGALLSLESTASTAEQRSDVLSAQVVTDDFYSYLTELEGKLGAHAYAELASKLDIGAVGGVVLENMAEARDKLLQRVLIGALSEALMVLASRQYIKAYNRELDALHKQTAWKVRAHLWRLSARKRPELTPGDRTLMVNGLLAPLFHKDTPPEAKPILLGTLFQVLILCFTLDGLALAKSESRNGD
jgi:hypothetical protein